MSWPIFSKKAIAVPKIWTSQNIHVVYPEMTGNYHSQIIAFINECVQEHVYEAVRAKWSGQTGVIGKYEIKLNSRGLLSFYFNWDVSSRLSEAELTETSSLNFNMHSGQLYALNHLFVPGKAYEEKINEYIQQEIKSRRIEITKEFQGITEYQPFFLTSKTLGIYFQADEYTHQENGVLVFEIPISLLKRNIAPNTPLSQLA